MGGSSLPRRGAGRRHPVGVGKGRGEGLRLAPWDQPSGRGGASVPAVWLVFWRLQTRWAGGGGGGESCAWAVRRPNRPRSSATLPAPSLATSRLQEVENQGPLEGTAQGGWQP